MSDCTHDCSTCSQSCSERKTDFHEKLNDLSSVKKVIAVVSGKKFFVRLGLKVTLAELNIGREHFNEMADRATKGGKQTVGHYIPLDSKRIEDILELAEPVTL